MNIKLPKSEQNIIDDPFLTLGYGLNAYFDIMVSLSYMCLCIMLFMSPIFYGYANNPTKGLQHNSKYALMKYTMGNLGGSTIFCNQRKIEVGDMRITCPMG
jgi:hypothetical protein